MNGFLIVILIYGLLLAAAGVFLSRSVRGVDDFFVAGRKLGPGLLFCTVLAANIGAGSTVGAAGLGYRLGLGGWWWVGSAGIGSLFLALWVGPRIRDFAAGRGLLTVGDFLEWRYGKPVRGLVAALLWCATLAILAGQLIAFARILEVVAGSSKVTGCLIGGIVVVTYFSASGLKGTAWINLVQLLVKGVGFLVALPLALWSVGGWSGLVASVSSRPGFTPGYFDLTGIGIGGILGYVFLLAPAFIVSPGLIQKAYGARDARSVRLGIGANALVLLVFAFFPVMLGMTAAAAFPGLAHEELALPTVMTGLVPFWVGAILLAAVFSAEVSSADAVLFMLSTSLSRDLYQTFLNPEVDDSTLLRVSRQVSAVAGALGVLLAILLPSVIDALSVFYGLLSVALFVPLILGLYSVRPGLRACLWAIVLSVLSAGLLHVATGGTGVGMVSPTAFGIGLSLIVMTAGHLSRGRSIRGHRDRE